MYSTQEAPGADTGSHARSLEPTALAPPWVSSTLYDLVIVELYFPDAVLGNRLNRHALEVYGHSPLELVRAELEQLHTLDEGDVWVVVLVEDG